MKHSILNTRKCERCENNLEDKVIRLESCWSYIELEESKGDGSKSEASERKREGIYREDKRMKEKK